MMLALIFMAVVSTVHGCGECQGDCCKGMSCVPKPDGDPCTSGKTATVQATCQNGKCGSLRCPNGCGAKSEKCCDSNCKKLPKDTNCGGATVLTALETGVLYQVATDLCNEDGDCVPNPNGAKSRGHPMASAQAVGHILLTTFVILMIVN